MRLNGLAGDECYNPTRWNLPEAPRFRFGLFSADSKNGDLWKNGRRIRLQQQPFRVLVLLLERAGSVVSREELRKALWPSDTFVDFDEGLNTAVRKLRQTLGDPADHPVFIETVPRKGYRFIAPVASAGTPRPPSDPPGRRGARILAALAIATAGVAAVWLIGPRSAAPPIPSPVPLTSYIGVETQPSFSPDGRQVVFVWNGESEDNSDIYIKPISADKPLRLTTDSAQDFGPAWSPDGRLIAFGRILNSNRTGIFLTPVSAPGPEVKVTEVSTPHITQPLPFLAWSPDGRWLAVTDRDDAEVGRSRENNPTSAGLVPKSLFLVSIETGERRRLTAQAERPVVDAAPAFSPDGGLLAFVRASALGVSELYILPLSRGWAPEGAPRRLTSENRETTGPAWTRDGTHIVFSSGPHQDLRLWQIPADGKGTAHRLEFTANQATCPSISRQGQLAYAQASEDQNIWRVELSGPGSIASPAKRFIASTRIDGNPRFSPDGKRLVFVSDRGASLEIWIANADGTQPAPLTSMRASITGGPNWSPDGSHVVFDSNKDGNWDVYVISAAGGPPRRLTNNPAIDAVPSWSSDGKSIYFTSDRSGERQVWKMPSSGGEAIQVTKNRGYVSMETPDSRFVYYSKAGAISDGVWRMPVGGGEETKLTPSVTLLNFAVTSDGIYFIPGADSARRHSIFFFSFASEESRPVLTLNGDLGYGLTVSPDGKTLLYSQIDHRGSDLMLVDDFRGR